MTFRIGQKVVSILDWSNLKHKYPQIVFPVLNGVYTIRDIDTRGDGFSLRFEEFVNPEMWLTTSSGKLIGEPGFAVVHFRPLIERKTDISVFTAMLKPRTKVKSS